MADGDHKLHRISGEVKPAGAGATTIGGATFTLAANQSARVQGMLQCQPSQNLQDGGHYSARVHFSVRYSGGSLSTTAAWAVADAHGSLGAGITFGFADGGSGVVNIQATGAQNYRCSFVGEVEIIEQART